VLLIHAGVADQRMWDPVAELLAPRHRVVRYDMRGFGRSRSSAGTFSPVADALAVLSMLGVESATVVGASYGGAVALQLALAAPDRVEALVLLASALPGHEWSAKFKDFAAREEAAIERGDLDEAVELTLRMWVDGPARRPEESDQRIRSLVADMQRRAIELQVADELDDAEIDPPVSERLGSIRTPAIVMIGDRDVEDFAHIADRLVAELPAATLRRVPGAGHLLAFERPDAVADAILG
jgi:pimeloyl-ACP methyl ester carboxylesterase